MTDPRKGVFVYVSDRRMEMDVFEFIEFIVKRFIAGFVTTVGVLVALLATTGIIDGIIQSLTSR